VSSPATGLVADLTEWFDRLDFDRGHEATRYAEFTELMEIVNRSYPAQKPFHPDSNLPGCMMPDGGHCCEAYAALCTDWHRLNNAAPAQHRTYGDHDTKARECLRPIRGCATDEQWRDVLACTKQALQDAFDLGFRAAGGSVASTSPPAQRQDRNAIAETIWNHLCDATGPTDKLIACGRAADAIVALNPIAQEQRHPEDRTIFVLQEIARGRCDNGRPLSGETARNMARSALDFWPGKNPPVASTDRTVKEPEWNDLLCSLTDLINDSRAHEATSNTIACMVINELLAKRLLPPPSTSMAGHRPAEGLPCQPMANTNDVYCRICGDGPCSVPHTDRTAK
jgi:hypothetical protein